MANTTRATRLPSDGWVAAGAQQEPDLYESMSAFRNEQDAGTKFAK